MSDARLHANGTLVSTNSERDLFAYSPSPKRELCLSCNRQLTLSAVTVAFSENVPCLII
jgi:hypothetical protein